MEAKAFRALMVAALVLFVVPEMVDNPWKDWLSSHDSPSLVRMFLVTGSIVAAFFGLAFVGFVGMYNFRAWGRTISLITTILLYAAWGAVLPFLQPTSGSVDLAQTDGFISFVGQLSALCWGGALSLAYLSPLSAQFGANNSFKPKPLRSST